MWPDCPSEIRGIVGAGGERCNHEWNPAEVRKLGRLLLRERCSQTGRRRIKKWTGRRLQSQFGLTAPTCEGKIDPKTTVSG